LPTSDSGFLNRFSFQLRSDQGEPQHRHPTHRLPIGKVTFRRCARRIIGDVQQFGDALFEGVIAPSSIRVRKTQRCKTAGRASSSPPGGDDRAIVITVVVVVVGHQAIDQGDAANFCAPPGQSPTFLYCSRRKLLLREMSVRDCDAQGGSYSGLYTRSDMSYVRQKTSPCAPLNEVMKCGPLHSVGAR
jgi:hypothetical protein